MNRNPAATVDRENEPFQVTIPAVRAPITAIHAGDVIYIDGKARLVTSCFYEDEYDTEHDGYVTRTWKVFGGWVLSIRDDAAPEGERLAHIVDDRRVAEARFAVRHLAVKHTVALPDDWCAACHLVADDAHRHTCPPF